MLIVIIKTGLGILAFLVPFVVLYLWFGGYIGKSNRNMNADIKKLITKVRNQIPRSWNDSLDDTYIIRICFTLGYLKRQRSVSCIVVDDKYGYNSITPRGFEFINNED